jgi:hypothetical protein
MPSKLERPSRSLGLLRRLSDARLATGGALAEQARAGAPIVAEPPGPVLPPPLADGSIWWGREQFYSCSASGRHEPCPEVVDVTGPRRALVFGPYFPLEPGLWRATAMFELCPDAARRQLVVDFGAMPSFRFKEPAHQPGRHVIELDYEVQREDLVEVRLLMRAAGFHGEVRFLGAFLERLGDAR